MDRLQLRLACFAVALGFPAIALCESVPSSIRPLSTEDCAKIQRLPDGSFRIAGTIQIGSFIIVNSTIGRNGIVVGGVDNYDVIERSCFKDRPI